MNSAAKNSDSRLAEQLKRLLLAIDASGQTVLGGSSDVLLTSIVEAAAKIFGAASASILLINEEEQALQFKVACGRVEQDVIGSKFPLDKGIAGYVAMTGQPIATSHVTQDARFDREFAESTGYVPESILAAPLVSGDRIIGVMEVLDKINADSFGIQDMELLGMFARQAALAIDQAQQVQRIEQALITGLQRLASSDDSQDSSAILSVLDETSRERGSIPELLELADVFAEMSQLGEAERRLCLQILRSFADYRRSSRRRFA